MSSNIQDNRPVKIYSVLPENTLLFSSMTGVERLSELFEFELVLVSENAEIDPADLLGTDMTVELELPGGGFRYFHGYVADCADAPGEGELAGYEVSLRPWPWFLTRTADCRIFQEMSVPDIVRQILGEEGFTDVDDELTETYRPWVFCVQYRETDFNFISRLMEQEGIHYYFRHESGLHKLVLADGGSGHGSLPNYEEVPLFAPDRVRRDRDHLSDWIVRKQLQPGRFAVRDFNFEIPNADLQLDEASEISHANSDFEVYDYPGEYPERSAGEIRAQLLLEESETQHELAGGGGNVRGLLAGNCFTLTGAARERDNREYLVTGIECSFALANFRSGSGGGLNFRCSVTAMTSDRPYRAPRQTPKPIVQGPQTAKVVGPAGEEIWTDKYGRVKLQFHWDRYGTSDENSSCWVRVSQVHAGAGFGGIDIPRIGEEVIVEFLEGDPDRPIVTGRVYNGVNGTPTSLPAAGMVSGLKSNSTPGGGGYNEITLDDTKDKEKMSIHAQYDRSSTVQHDDTLTVNNDRTVTVKNHLKTTVTEGNQEHLVETGTSLHEVKGAVTEKFSASQETTVTDNITIKSTGGAVEIHSDSISVNVEAATSIKLHTGASTIELDSAGNISITGVNVSIKGSATVAVSGAMITSKADAMNQTSGATVLSDGSATNVVKGGVVMLNP